MKHRLVTNKMCSARWPYLMILPTELPKPHLGDLSDLRMLSAQVRRQKNPSVLNYSYKDLVGLDSVAINLVPEKKGLLLKHVEYEIKSEVGIVKIYVLFWSMHLLNPNSLDNKGSWSILKDFYCSVTMCRELGLMQIMGHWMMSQTLHLQL